MIITLASDELTKTNAAVLAKKFATVEVSLSRASELPHVKRPAEDHSLILMDLSATGNFQEGLRTEYGVKLLVDKLVANNWLKETTVIDLYISDIITADPAASHLRNLLQIAEDLVGLIYQHSHQEVTLRLVTNYRYDITLVAPPSAANDNKWQVFGIQRNTLPPSFRPSLENLLSLKDKTLLWEGENLDDYLKDMPEIKPISQFGMRNISLG